MPRRIRCRAYFDQLRRYSIVTPVQRELAVAGSYLVQRCLRREPFVRPAFCLAALARYHRHCGSTALYQPITSGFLAVRADLRSSQWRVSPCQLLDSL